MFNTVKEAVRATGANCSITFVAPAFCADAIMEAADAGIALVCSITDGIPAQDMMRVKRYLLRYQRGRRTMLVGPNCAGIISPGKAMLGIMPSNIYMRGSVGIVSRSGTLGYEAAAQMKQLGIGVSTSVGIGGDPINGSSFLDHLILFEQDPETEAVMMIGEIGGPQEAEAAAWIKNNMTKPVVGYVAGLTAPKGRRMGHAGAIISASGDSAAEKAEIMKSYGLTVAPSPSELGAPWPSYWARAMARARPRSSTRTPRSRLAPDRRGRVDDRAAARPKRLSRRRRADQPGACFERGVSRETPFDCPGRTARRAEASILHCRNAPMSDRTRRPKIAALRL